MQETEQIFFSRLEKHYKVFFAGIGALASLLGSFAFAYNIVISIMKSQIDRLHLTLTSPSPNRSKRAFRSLELKYPLSHEKSRLIAFSR